MRDWLKLIENIYNIIFSTGLLTIFLPFLIGNLFNKIQHIFIMDSYIFEKKKTLNNIFIITTFKVMGHLAKSKGFITEKDISYANFLIKKMNLNKNFKLLAQKSFYEGKDNTFQLRICLQQFYKIYRENSNFLGDFFKIQMKVALLDGFINYHEIQILKIIADELNIDISKYINSSTKTDPNNSLQKEKAYRILGIDNTANFDTIKRAYIKLMNEYHPDKLIAKGLSSQEMNIAKEKVQDIQNAYNILKKNNK